MCFQQIGIEQLYRQLSEYKNTTLQVKLQIIQCD